MSLPPQVSSRVMSITHNIRVCPRKLARKEKDRDTLLFQDGEYPDVYFTKAWYFGNNLYGIERTLKSYARYSSPIKAPVEHGLYFGSYVREDETTGSRCPVLLTFGPQRRRHITEKTNTPVLEIGPYIHYASDFLYQDEIAELKKKLGRTLLVFPAHSTAIDVRFNYEKLFQAVRKIEKQYDIDSTFYCLYFHDINLGKAKYFTEKGKSVVCAGHRFDPLFLSKLKSLIQMSDITASNGVGTHIGYCEYLHKPHIFVDMEMETRGEAKENGQDYKLSQEKEMKEVKSAFLTMPGTAIRRQVCEKYWGFSSVRSSAFLETALGEIELAYRAMHKERLCPQEAIEEYCHLLSPLVI